MIQARDQFDPYVLLQVSPNASIEEIADAYERLRDLYGPERTAAAAPELQELAAEKRAQIDAAYQLLSQAEQRAAFDREHGLAPVTQAPPTDEPIDYRPLPPARGQERVVPPSVQEPPTPRRAARREGMSAWLMPLITAIVALSLLLLIILSGVRTTSGGAAVPTPPARVNGVELQLPFSDAQLKQFRSAAETANTAETWAALGNALFDNMQTLRENAPQSPQYRGSLQNWLDAAQAYERSLALKDSATVRSDRAAAQFNYGVDAPDGERVQAAVAEVERGMQAGVKEPRALLNYGLILSSLNPPRTEEALAQWRKVIEVAPQSEEAQRAQALLQQYGQK